MSASDVHRNERGNRIGESHPNCNLPDVVVNMLRDIHEHHRRAGPTHLARLMGIKASTISKIIYYQKRTRTRPPTVP